MTVSYDPTLPAALDRVRFLVGDTDTTKAMISDEEITAVLALYTTTNAEGKAHLAAADVLSAIWAELSTKGRGIVRKEVGRLGISYGSDSSAAEAIASRIAYLRERGAALASTASPVYFQAY